MKARNRIAAFLLQALCCFALAISSPEVRGADVLEAAKKEGEVVFYASMEVQNSQALAGAFERKYPFIKVTVTRIGSERMATRIVAEARSGKVRADVIHQSGFDFYGVLQKGLLEAYDSPERAFFPADHKDEQGLWTADSSTLNVIAYNTRMVPAAEAPRSFWDLTQPRWKGQLLMDENESKWMAGVFHHYGEAKGTELMRKLAAQNLQFRTGHSLIATLVAAGERPVGVVAFANGVERLKKEGAPIEWVAAEPLIGLTFGLGILKNAPHPNAARLFVDFVLSRPGQEVIAAANYYVARKDVQSPILKRVPGAKVIPLPMEMAKKYNDYFQTYRRLMGLK
ncbi:MAG TPA: extracellular solute-binding protein [candidate division Zixibacteria bacterium]|nr:extracellular solute-binding protein [candidate division Zixibacteria bacterium]